MSDSSDGQSEKCPICLRNFTTQEIGTPEACDHSFCVECLQEWSRVRITFKYFNRCICVQIEIMNLERVSSGANKNTEYQNTVS